MLLHPVFNHLDCRSIDVLVEGDLEVVPRSGYSTSSFSSTGALHRIVLASVDICLFLRLHFQVCTVVIVWLNVIFRFPELCLDCQAASGVSISVAISQLARGSNLN